MKKSDLRGPVNHEWRYALLEPNPEANLEVLRFLKNKPSRIGGIPASKMQ